MAFQPMIRPGRSPGSNEPRSLRKYSSFSSSVHRGSSGSQLELEHPYGSMDSQEEEEEEDGDDRNLEDVPFAKHTKMRIDDQHATYVIIFPRQKDKHGPGFINPKAPRRNPVEAWHRIFKRKFRKKDKDPRDKAPSALWKGAVTEDVFQELVRDRVKEILKNSGIQADAEESVDGDEVFLKLYMNRSGNMIQQLAEHTQYQMPYKAECYRDEKHIGPYKGGQPMVNDDGVEVCAFEEYRIANHEMFQDFRGIDEVRLLFLHLNSQVNLKGLLEEGVISGHFPGADYKVMKELTTEWADWTNIFLIPSEKDEEAVRSYFGEEITFFFRWLGMYSRMLMRLAGVSIVCLLQFLPGMGVTMLGRDLVKVFFGFVVVMWEAYFQKMNRSCSVRAVQAWGMEEDCFNSFEPQLPDYDPDKEGTPGLRLKKYFLQVVVVLYLLLFMGVIFTMNRIFYRSAMSGNDNLAYWRPWIQSLLTKLLSFTWRKMAGPLVRLGNHRTQSRLNNALIVNLSMVKLFVALWPFFHIVALQRWIEVTSGPSLSAAAHQVYKSGWPEGVPHIDAEAGSGIQIPLSQLEFLNGYWYMKGNLTFIMGCYPVECYSEPSVPFGSPGPEVPMATFCRTNCVKSMQSSLRTLFVIQLGSCILFTVVPVLLTTLEVRREIARAKRVLGDQSMIYSFIQLQAKRWNMARYEFQYWGGSYVEDFMEMAVSHALLACFSMVFPWMSVIAFICIQVQYRLLAYRMTNVTCRPFPHASLGIGVWGGVFEFVSWLSVFFNVLVAVMMMLPMRTWSLPLQIGVFAVGEKVLLLMRDMVEYVIPKIPPEVVLIRDFNQEFRKTLQHFPPASPDEQEDYSNVEIGLQGPEPAESESDSDLSTFELIRRTTSGVHVVSRMC